MTPFRIGIVGTGHVGLVNGACFAEVGHQVVCVDKNQEVIQKLSDGIVPIYEPGLEELVRKNHAHGRLQFSSDIKDAVADTQIVILAVGTPRKNDGSVDLTSVESASRGLASHLNGYRVIAERSTVPVKTGEWVQRTLRLFSPPGASFDVVSLPEFLREGSAIEDFMQPSRVVIGVESKRAEAILRQLFEPFGAPLIVTDIKTAELIKHASNSFLATKISYINAVSRICELVGADVRKVAEGMGYDSRIGKEFLQAGVGYGGYCLPKDVSAFIKMAQELGYDFDLLKAVEKINNEQHTFVIRHLKETLWLLNEKVIAVLGLAFKPNTDDIRDAVSLDVISLLQKEGAVIRAYDPAAMQEAARVTKNITFCSSPYEAVHGAHAAVFLTEWQEFSQLDFTRVKELMAVPIIIDGRNMFEKQQLCTLGFEYRGIGV